VCALSGAEPARLSSKQEAVLPAYREHWTRTLCSTAPANRSAAEQGVVLAYQAAGVAPPERIEWCQSPIGIESARKQTWHQFDPGPSVKTRIVDDVIREVGARVEDAVPVRVRVAAGTELDIERRFSSASSALANALSADAARVRWGAFWRTRFMIRRLGGNRLTHYVPFEQSRWLPHEGVSMLAKTAYLYNVCGFVSATTALSGLWQIAENAGGMVPHTRICWLSERPDTLALDPSGRLHSATGPAVRYPDRWSLHSWKGVAVPKWVIEHCHHIGRQTIDNERNPIIRRCMIDIMTPERYIATGAARRVAVDNTGILWRRNWHDWWDAWAAVEVVNGTPEPDGTRKRYFLQVPPEMRTPTEAVAWTYGMSARRYAALERRT
jgi:hypothetical protein